MSDRVLRPRPGAKKPGSNPENKPDEKQVIETEQVENEIEGEGKKKEGKTQEMQAGKEQKVEEKKKKEGKKQEMQAEKELEMEEKKKKEGKERPKSPGTNPENKSGQEQKTKTGQVKIKEVEEKKKEKEKEGPKSLDAIPKNVPGQEQESEEEEDDDEEGEDYEEYDDEEEDDEEGDEEEKDYNPRITRKPRAQTAKVDSTNLVKGKTKNNEASSSIHDGPSKYRLLATAAKSKSVYATTTDSTASFVEPAEVKEQIEKRIKYYIEEQRPVAIRYLYNKEKQLDINDLLTKLDELSARPGSGKLLRALYKRHSPQPPFLTVRDFARDSEDESLAWKKPGNVPVVYAVTICIPDWLYDCMMERPELCEKKVLKNRSFDDKERLVHLRGKIGETKNFDNRVGDYNTTERTGQLGPIFCYLRKKAKESKPNPFTDWVKVWPILSGEGMEVLDTRIKMETLCSFLLGRAGNSGYNFIGRFNDHTLEEMQASARRLNNDMDKSFDGENGRTTKRKLSKAKWKETMSAKTINFDGEEELRLDIQHQKMLEGLKVVKPRKDGRLLNGIQQGVATKCARDSLEAIKEINDFVDRMGLAGQPGYIPPRMIDTSTGARQYGWEAKCAKPDCDLTYCVTYINENDPNTFEPPRCRNKTIHSETYLIPKNCMLEYPAIGDYIKRYK
ncbi:unnamed protein product [Adineta steineri]|uniref:Uncharacterized protein n=1 Tax=Adineta steineri TaxID=433720 RepID=A0A816E8D8_9BILA|nr:unnamed protein product [Adineta steineri]CAF1644318.1 unnamed protein product [Adineta steineri]